jgi:uncharacterized membrane protein
MTLVTASIDIAAPRERVFGVVLDPARLDEWVTIHRRVNDADDGPPRQGFEMVQTLHLRGANIKVRWKLTELQEDRHVTWEGRGPAHSYARTSYSLSDLDSDGTHFQYENEFKAPGGFIGVAASRVLVGGQPQREANRSLQQLKALLEQ